MSLESDSSRDFCGWLVLHRSAAAAEPPCCHIGTPQRRSMTPPPPAEPLASRILLGPALRTQPDRRLVTLVREGYEAAFEEIVRRYRQAARPLRRLVRRRPLRGRHPGRLLEGAAGAARLRGRDRAAALALPDRPQHGAQRPARQAAEHRGAGRGARRRSQRRGRGRAPRGDGRADGAGCERCRSRSGRRS